MATTFLSCAGAIWWCLAVALLLLTLCCGLVQPIVQERRATAAARPPVSVILPIKSLDPGFVTAQASIFTQDYPNYEILISAAEVASPALDEARPRGCGKSLAPVPLYSFRQPGGCEP